MGGDWHRQPMPKGKITIAEELAQIIGTTPGTRFHEPDGTTYKTGQTASGIRYVIDIAGLLEQHVRAIEEAHGMGRALRFVDWVRGRRISSFWRVHRGQLMDDRDMLVVRMSAGGYYTSEDDRR